MFNSTKNNYKFILNTLHPKWQYFNDSCQNLIDSRRITKSFEPTTTESVEATTSNLDKPTTSKSKKYTTIKSKKHTTIKS